MKGLAQAISCYEWLGEDLHVEVGKLDASSVEIEPILVSLHEKNPHNPWYASLLANLYFHRGERIWGKIPRDDKWYRKAATVCLEAVHQIRWSHLRPLHGLLLTCLDVQESWQELGFRAEQAYGEDQTFALAHALRARALFLGSDGNSPSSEHVIKAAEQQAERTITLFKDPHDDETHEALFIANLVSAACNAERKQERPALKALEHAVQHAKSANLWWARAELQTLQTKHFEPLFGEDRRWRKIMTQLDSLAKAQGDGQVRHSKRRRTSHPAVNKNRSFRVRGKRNA
jgi:hypothetical protein